MGIYNKDRLIAVQDSIGRIICPECYEKPENNSLKVEKIIEDEDLEYGDVLICDICGIKFFEK